MKIAPPQGRPRQCPNIHYHVPCPIEKQSCDECIKEFSEFINAAHYAMKHGFSWDREIDLRKKVDLTQGTEKRGQKR